MPKANSAAQHMEQDLSRERGGQDERMQDESDSSSLLRSGAFDGIDEAQFFQVENLKAPPPRLGYEQRWVRVSILNEDDFSNLQRQLHFGYRPRRLDSVPEGVAVSSIKHGDFAGVIGSRDAILCERPIAIGDQHRAALLRRTQHQTRAITGELEKIEHAAMPIDVDMTSRVKHGSGRRPPVMPDASSET